MNPYSASPSGYKPSSYIVVKKSETAFPKSSTWDFSSKEPRPFEASVHLTAKSVTAGASTKHDILKAKKSEDLLLIMEKYSRLPEPKKIAERIRNLEDAFLEEADGDKAAQKMFLNSLRDFLLFSTSVNSQVNPDIVLAADGRLQVYWEDSDGKLIIRFTPKPEVAYLEGIEATDRTILRLDISKDRLLDFVLTTGLIGHFFAI